MEIKRNLIHCSLRLHRKWQQCSTFYNYSRGCLQKKQDPLILYILCPLKTDKGTNVNLAIFYFSLNPTVVVMSEEWGSLRCNTASSQESKQNDTFCNGKGQLPGEVFPSSSKVLSYIVLIIFQAGEEQQSSLEMQMPESVAATHAGTEELKLTLCEILDFVHVVIYCTS